MSAARYGHRAVRLRNGNVLVIGGKCTSANNGCYETSEEYNVATNSWSSPIAVNGHGGISTATATLLNDGSVLYVGGTNQAFTSNGLPRYWVNSNRYDPTACRAPGGGGGFVSGSVSAAASIVELTGAGELDWNHANRGGAFLHKNVGTTLVSDPIAIGAPTVNWTNDATTYHWTDGTPTASSSNATIKYFQGSTGKGFYFTVPAELDFRLLHVYLGAATGTGKLRAFLNDNSCSAFETTVSGKDKDATIRFLGASAGSYLTVQFTLNATGRLDYGGAALANGTLAHAVFEGDEDPDKVAYSVFVDNPLVTSPTSLIDVPSASAGMAVGQAIDADPSAYIFSSGDAEIFTSGGEDPSADNTAPIYITGGAVNDTLFAWPNPNSSLHLSSGDSTALLSRGIRVGYNPLGVQTKSSDRTSSSYGSAVSVALDPSVDLVPIQVAVMYSDTYPPSTSRAEMLNLFDQISAPDVSRFFDGAGELDSIQRSFLGISGSGYTISPFLRPAGAPATVQVRGIITPDSALSSCGVQFRLVNYFEVYGPDRMNVPVKGGSEYTDSQYPNGTNDNTPCNESAEQARASGHALDNVPLVVFKQRAGFAGTGEDGRYVPTADASCVSFQGSKSPVTVAHELGHNAGLGDCTGSATCQLMISLGGGAVPPSSYECGVIKTWAHGRSLLYYSR